ncbi:hypothetical protein [Photobacterium sp.]|uniref:hypothetical protein n=1 Tax=Photobacterium sp. TaxID=660 RepID=UPI00299EC70F|nr:hypothetical protein [Photobacterium sp.]MDX1304562.1 hypothetical protein [Photobacterium sp.]
MKKILTIILTCVLSTTAMAWDSEGGNFKVSKLRFGSGVVHVALNPAPSGCGGGDHYRMHFSVKNVDPVAYKDMVSALLSAHATGQTFSTIWYSGKGLCSNNHVLTLDMFEYATK